MEWEDAASLKKALEESYLLINQRDEHGCTLLHTAKSGEIAKILIESGANIDACDYGEASFLLSGVSPLSHPIMARHRDVLVRSNAWVRKQHYQGLRPIHYAVAANRVDVARELLVHNCSLDSNNWLQIHPFHFVWSVEMINLLIPYVSNWTEFTRFRLTVLHLAAAHIDVEPAAIELLVSLNVSVDAFDSFRAVPICCARRVRTVEVLEKLGTDFRKIYENPFILQAQISRNTWQDDACVKAMKKHFSVSGRAWGQSAIHAAKCLEYAKILIENGAEVNSGWSQRTYTPLHFADTVEKAALLLDHGAVVNARTRSERGAVTPLLDTAHADIARILIDRGATLLGRACSYTLEPWRIDIHDDDIDDAVFRDLTPVLVQREYSAACLPCVQLAILRYWMEVRAQPLLSETENYADRYDPIAHALSPEVVRFLRDKGGFPLERQTMLMSIRNASVEMVRYLMTQDVELKMSLLPPFSPAETVLLLWETLGNEALYDRDDSGDGAMRWSNGTLMELMPHLLSRGISLTRILPDWEKRIQESPLLEFWVRHCSVAVWLRTLCGYSYLDIGGDRVLPTNTENAVDMVFANESLSRRIASFVCYA